jgi:hypothetical protein
MKGMTADQHASDGRHNVTGSRHRSMAAGAGAGLSIVVPVYNEAAGLAQLHGPGSAESPPRCATSAGLPAIVDDGSPDASLDVAHGLPADVADVQGWYRCRIQKLRLCRW